LLVFVAERADWSAVAARDGGVERRGEQAPKGVAGWVNLDIAAWAVPAGFIGALLPVATGPELYFTPGIC
jgi:hypothetical protein